MWLNECVYHAQTSRPQTNTCRTRLVVLRMQCLSAYAPLPRNIRCFIIGIVPTSVSTPLCRFPHMIHHRYPFHQLELHLYGHHAVPHRRPCRTPSRSRLVRTASSPLRCSTILSHNPLDRTPTPLPTRYRATRHHIGLHRWIIAVKTVVARPTASFVVTKGTGGL